MRKLYTLLLLAVIACPLSAQFQKNESLCINKIGKGHPFPAQSVRSITQDSAGFIWMGTENGLLRYDGVQYRVYKAQTHIPNGLEESNIREVYFGPKGNLWVIGSRGSLYRYEPDKDYFQPYLEVWEEGVRSDLSLYAVFTDRSGRLWFGGYFGLYYYDFEADKIQRVFKNWPGYDLLSQDCVTGIAEDETGQFWLGTLGGKVILVDWKEQKLNELDAYPVENSDVQRQINDVIVDSKGHIWLSTSTGFCLFGPDSRLEYCYTASDLGLPDQSRESCLGVFQDSQERIWVLFENSGPFFFDQEARQLLPTCTAACEAPKLSNETIVAIFEDDTQGIWLGTTGKGAYLSHPVFNRFRHYSEENGNTTSRPFGQVNAVSELGSEQLLLATDGLGLQVLDMKTGSFSAIPEQSNLAQNGVITDLVDQTDGSILMSSWNGDFGILEAETLSIQLIDDADCPNPATHLQSIADRGDGTIWLAAFEQGCLIYDQEEACFYSESNHPEVSIDLSALKYVNESFVDSKGRIWLGTPDQSLYCYDGRSLIQFPNANCDLDQNINDITEDEEGWIWVGTKGGLYAIHPALNKSHRFGIEDGLLSDNIKSLIFDSRRNLWLATDFGLSRMQWRYQVGSGIELEQLKNYSTGETGSIQFSPGEAIMLKDKRLVFATLDGVLAFSPDRFSSNQFGPEVAITNLLIGMSPIRIGDETGILDQPIELISQLHLTYDQSDISFEYAALNFIYPSESSYAVWLEGLEDDWRYLSDETIVHYPNLDPGDYVFKVKAANSDGFWSSEEKRILICVYPPWWKSNWAYLIYACLVIGIGGFGFSVVKQNRELYKRQELLHSETRLENALMQQFFQTTRSFRTPLSLVLSPLKDLSVLNLGFHANQKVQLANHNAQRILNIVDRLQALKKVDEGKHALSPVKADFIDHVKQTFSAFQGLAEAKQIGLDFFSVNPSQEAWFDPYILDRLVYDLIALCLRGSKSDEKILVEAKVEEEATESGLFKGIITVRTTSSNYPSDKIIPIVDGSETATAVPQKKSEFEETLLLILEMVHLHEGQLFYEAGTEEAAVYIINIPISLQAFSGKIQQRVTEEHSEKLIFSNWRNNLPLKGKQQQEEEANRIKPKVIIAEQDEDFRAYLKQELRGEFNVSSFILPAKILEESKSLQPQVLIIGADLPELKQFDLLGRLENDPHTQHIPIVLMINEDRQMEELKQKTTVYVDFVLKPFAAEEISFRLRRLINLRENFRALVGLNEIPSPLSHRAGKEKDEVFLMKILARISQDLKNPDLNVDFLAKEYSMSRMHLYRKIKESSGLSPRALLRKIRMERAKELLVSGDYTVAEAALEVGFPNSSQFGRAYKSHFGETPSQSIKGSSGV